MDSSQALLDRGLAELGLDLGDPLQEKFLELGRLVSAWAPRVNLTGHRSLEDVLRWLVLDALAMAPHLPAGESLLDLGSGAGFPGLPLAILEPDRQIVLVDSRRRRHHFQRAAIRQLGLSNVEARLGRSEELSEPVFHVVVAQALAAPKQSLALMFPWLRVGGWLVLAAGPDGPGTVPRPASLGPGYSRSYSIPTLAVRRSVWTAQRVS
ncbi:MAG: 16S rRNA (guanine(527)-N(7))-methyltransferase RsmG [Myxococcota bacterium]